MASSTAGRRDDLAAAHLLVGRDDDRGADVADALLQALGREAAEHHGVGHAQARAGLHGDHRLDRHGHVDDGAVALLVAQLGQAIGEAAHAGQQFAVGDAVDLAVVGFENDGGLVGVAIGQVHVQTVGRYVQLAVAEPAVERGVGLIQHLGEGLGPLQVGAGLAGPESVKVVLDLGAQFLVGVHARDRGALRSALGRRKDPGFHQDGLNGIRHDLCLQSVILLLMLLFSAHPQPYRHALTGTLRKMRAGTRARTGMAANARGGSAKGLAASTSDSLCATVPGGVAGHSS